MQMQTHDPLAADVLEFWLGNDPTQPVAKREHWFKKDPDFDAALRTRFGAALEQAAAGGYRAWWTTAPDVLAYVILCDQFSRNVHRDTPRAFAWDPLALQASLSAQQAGLHRELPPLGRLFLTMPMVHCEHMALQHLAVETMQRLGDELEAAVGDSADELLKTVRGFADAAVRHRVIVERFGRFPHRNAILGRESTPAETAFLTQPGSGF